MVFLFETRQNFGEEFSNVFRAFLDDSDGGKNGFFSNVGAVVVDTFKDFVMKLSCQLSSTDFTDNAEHQPDNTVISACQIDSQSVCSHHEQF